MPRALRHARLVMSEQTMYADVQVKLVARVDQVCEVHGRWVPVDVIERALGAELGMHLAEPEGRRGHHRNGRSGKTVLTDEGALRIEVPPNRHTRPLAALAHGQPSLPVQPMDALEIDFEPFALDQDVQPPVAETPSLAGQLDQAPLQAIVLSLGGVLQHAARQAQYAAGAPLGHMSLGPHDDDGVAWCLRAQNFPRATTFNASLSSIASASSFLSLLFSASNARRRLASGTSMPPNFRRHR